MRSKYQEHVKNTSKLRTILFIAIALVSGSGYISAPVALILGFLFSLTLGNPSPQTTSKLTSWLLKASVVGLGFGMNIHEAMATSKEGLWLTVCSITIVLGAGFFLGRWLGIDKRMTHLISSGTAICGGSAIAAIAPAIDAKGEQISLSLGVIFLLNSIALVIFPFLGHFFALTEHQFGLWCAIAIHDTSSVVGAASTYGSEALQVATTVKLTRALWIIPISLLSALLFRSQSKKISLPWFIALFVGAMLLNSYLELGAVASTIYHISKNLLVITLFLIGSAISTKAIKECGIRPIVLGVSLWVIISVISFIAIVSL